MTSKPYRKGDQLIEFVRDVIDRGFIVLEVRSGVPGFTDALRELVDQVPENLSESERSLFWGSAFEARTVITHQGAVYREDSLIV